MLKVKNYFLKINSLHLVEILNLKKKQIIIQAIYNPTQNVITN